jgi:hypothetical protein
MIKYVLTGLYGEYKRLHTMLNRFHAIKRARAQLSLPQSECIREVGFVQRGYEMKLKIWLVGMRKAFEIRTSCACIDSSLHCKGMKFDLRTKEIIDRTRHS